ncbi:MAG TPA: VTT domain-containing protein [Chthoniobacterales bacterium]|nr:VTT domain-containing protein [Chthoniobacterales bacterium]
MFSSIKAKLLVAAGLIIVLASVAYFFPLVPALEHVSAWLGGLGVIGAALFAVVIALSSLCLLPASPFIIAAAAVFGFSLGLLTSAVGIILGAASGYFLSRLFLRKDVADHLKSRPTFKAIDQAIAEEGWKIVLLLRLCPIPFGLANYLYGLTAIPFVPYLTTSFLGAVPGLILFCHLGSAGKAGLQALASGNLNKGGGEIVLLGLSLAATIVLVVLLPRIARRALEKRTKITITS